LAFHFEVGEIVEIPFSMNMTADKKKFTCAIEKFDQANNEDPNRETFRGKEYPKELLYANRMTDWLQKLAPDASEHLQLAARSQHICRWTIPRDSYEQNKKGYLLWRTELKKFHAQKAGEIMKSCGYDEETISRVQSLIRKEKMKVDPESQLLEDVVCLVFLESYFEDFSGQHSEEKLITIIQKTWNKMSDKGHLEALKLQLNPESHDLLYKALSDT